MKPLVLVVEGAADEDGVGEVAVAVQIDAQRAGIPCLKMLSDSAIRTPWLPPLARTYW